MHWDHQLDRCIVNVQLDDNIVALAEDAPQDVERIVWGVFGKRHPDVPA